MIYCLKTDTLLLRLQVDFCLFPFAETVDRYTEILITTLENVDIFSLADNHLDLCLISSPAFARLKMIQAASARAKAREHSSCQGSSLSVPFNTHYPRK